MTRTATESEYWTVGSRGPMNIRGPTSAVLTRYDPKTAEQVEKVEVAPHIAARADVLLAALHETTAALALAYHVCDSAAPLSNVPAILRDAAAAIKSTGAEP